MNSVDIQAINGSQGEAWVNNKYASNVQSLSAKIEISKEEIKQAKRMGTGQKVLGWKGTGTVKLLKTDSRFQKEFADSIKEGKTPSFSVMSKLNDPDVVGAETVYLSGCIPDSLSLIDWENSKVLEEELSFTFSNYEFMDYLEDVD